MEKWNDDWRTELKEYNYEVWERLADCRSRLSDVVCMSILMAKYNPTKEAEECLDRMIEWCGDWNSQDEIADITEYQYRQMLKRVLIATKEN